MKYPGSTILSKTHYIQKDMDAGARVCGFNEHWIGHPGRHGASEHK